MTPTIAIVACLLGIAGAFLVDRKVQRNVSKWTWLPTVWFILISSRSASSWIWPNTASQQGSAYVSGNPFDRAILTAIMVLGLLALSRRHIDWRNLSKSNRGLLLLYLYMAISVLWSAYRGMATRRLFRATGDIVMALIVLSEESPSEAISVIIRRSAFLLLPLSLVLVKYFRDLGIAYTEDGALQMWVGVTDHKNSLGILSSVAALTFLKDTVRDLRKPGSLGERVLGVGFLGLSLRLLWGSSTSRSATSMVVFLFGLAVFGWLWFLRRSRRNMGISTTVLLALALLAVLSTDMLTRYAGAFGRDVTLTGRTFIWPELISVGRQHGLLGVGYGSFWAGDPNSALWGYHWYREYNQAHNGYIDVFLELGVIGLLVLAVFLVVTFRNISRSFSRDYQYGSLRFLFFALILIHNVSESSLLRAGNFLWFLFVLVSIEIGSSDKTASWGNTVGDTLDLRACQ